MSDEPAVLVVHSVDTEGPLGGDARRLPDGSAEFFDNWGDILASLSDLTSDAFRTEAADSYGGLYRFSWFILDFTGFRTNPKNRVAEYHDTLDRMRSLPIELDGIYLHHHVPPASGAGDEWSDSWLSSNEINVVLARRLLERGEFPAAFRAGGTIEDNAASHWLEQVIPVDFSNRVSERSRPGADLYHFNWHGAPEVWGSYHPAHDDVLRAGSMKRWIYRSIDLRSRYNDVTQDHLDAVFREVADGGEHRVFSYFSHDNRDMRPETRDVIPLLRAAAEKTGVPWRSCTALEAHQLATGLEPRPVTLEIDLSADGIDITASSRPFQRSPFVAAELQDGRFVRLFAHNAGPERWHVEVDVAKVVRAGAAVTSDAGIATVVTTP